MRAIDKQRLLAMTEIKIRAEALLFLAKEYSEWYNDNSADAITRMDCMSDVWRLIGDTQIRLGEIIDKGKG